MPLMAFYRGKEISIHALRKESDLARKRVCGATGISIHALRKESDPHRRRPRP